MSFQYLLVIMASPHKDSLLNKYPHISSPSLQDLTNPKHSAVPGLKHFMKQIVIYYAKVSLPLQE